MIVDYYGGGVPGAPGNLGAVNLAGADATQPSFSGGVSPKARVTGGVPQTAGGAQDINLGGGGGNLNNAGVRERTRALLGQGKNLLDGMHTRVASNMQRSSLFPRSALLGGALMGGAATGLQDIQEGNVVRGGTNLAATGAGAYLTNQIVQSKAIRNPYVKLGALALGGIASAAGGQFLGGVAEDAYGKVTGKGDSQGAGITKRKKEAAAQADIIRTLQGAQMDTYVQANLQLDKAAMDNRILESQRMLPIINKMQDAALVRQQALNASNANNYMAMGTVATAGKLALGAQAEAGANFRTALTANPYANSALQAPQISFG